MRPTASSLSNYSLLFSLLAVCVVSFAFPFPWGSYSLSNKAAQAATLTWNRYTQCLFDLRNADCAIETWSTEACVVINVLY